MAALQRLALRGTPKATKAAARYTPAGGVERCGMCRHYVPSSSCARIEGPVSAAGWCQLYSQQVTWRPRAGQAAGGSASLDLSFLAPGALPAGLTFTRASTGTYFDATGTMQSATTNTPRWDYDPVAHGLNGLLIEEARTNSLHNSTMAGAVPGTPGTLPTNWTTNAGSTALSIQVVGTGNENGIPYLDVRLFGTAAAGQYSFIIDTTNTIAAVNGQVWTYSLYQRVVGGTSTNVGGFNLTLLELTAALATIRTDVLAVSTPTAAALSSQRVSGAITLIGGGTVAFIQPRYLFSAAAGAVDVTLRIGAPQLELGAGASSFIPTTTVGVARAADACSGATGAWFNAAASSLAADFMVAQAPNPSATLSRSPGGLSDGTAANRLRLLGQINNSSNAILASTITGTGTSSASLGATGANVTNKVAGAWNGTTGVGSLNGAATVSYAVGMPALSLLTIGSEPVGISYLNGWMRRVRYWNRALSAAELQSVTT